MMAIYPRRVDDQGRDLCSCGRLAVRTIRGVDGKPQPTCISEEEGRAAVAEYLAQHPEFAKLLLWTDAGSADDR